MTTRAEICIPRTLIHEGGFVDHPDDPGGATNKGITLATFRRYVMPRGTVADLKALTTEQAVIVYKRQYWDAVCADLLPAGVDFAVFDFGVNSGPARAARYLQKVTGAKIDGRIGPNTLAAVRAKDERVVVSDLCDARMAFLRRLPTYRTFGRGWSSRVARVRYDALLDAVA
ncbi:glycoside hydrolase family 108 protein [Celeribacter sp. SCSIO 80788]|uniref:glycoside hydrolase family 108 protein n=1 Tax=Celeribacter sp. SCSIO 80788 TaxID=3117013 RepID=UPI003DA561D4